MFKDEAYLREGENLVLVAVDEIPELTQGDPAPQAHKLELCLEDFPLRSRRSRVQNAVLGFGMVVMQVRMWESVYGINTFRAVYHEAGLESGIWACKLGRRPQQKAAERSTLVVPGSPSMIAHTGWMPGLQC